MDEVQLGLADLASFRFEFVRGGRDAIYPVVTPLPAVVKGDLDVEAVCLNALRIHFVDDRFTGAVGNDEVAFVCQPELAELFKVQDFLRFSHAHFLCVVGEISVFRLRRL